MKKFILIICISSTLVFNLYPDSPTVDNKILFERFVELYSSGDLIKAEKALIQFLESKDPLTNEQLAAGYNNLGAVNLTLGNYAKALEYNLKAESFISTKDRTSILLADIYNNRGRIFNIKKSFDVSLEYLEKSIRIYTNLVVPNKNVLNNLSSAYINISIALVETKKYYSALNFLKQNVKLNSENKLSGLALTYLNIAKTYIRMGDTVNAEEFYLKSISSFINEYDGSYYRLVDVYFDYSMFLMSAGKTAKAVELNKKALAISLKNYGEKHTIVSLAYKHLGDNFLNERVYDSALYYYQKSLIAIDRKFNNPDIFTNPSIDSSLFDIRLLDNLKSKAQAFELLAGEQKDEETKLKMTDKGLETIDLALELIDRIRNNYISEESRIYLAENEKETYLFATHLAYSSYLLTHSATTAYKMFDVAQKAKAAILRNEITGNELLYSSGIPDSLREKQNILAGNISAYNNLILEESRRSNPDITKISFWKDALFDMTRDKEKVTGEIENVYPQFHDLIRKTEPSSLKLIQKQMKNDETIIDYLLSNQYSDGKRKLYIFIISRNSLNFSERSLDSIFAKNASIIRNTTGTSTITGSNSVSFSDYTGALNYMYNNLIYPVRNMIKGKKLIIIPDEEIGWLSFDAFLKNKPVAGQTDYEGLSYLINDFTFSYSYSSSLIFAKKVWNIRGTRVFAFSPDYRNMGIEANTFSSLQGAGAEIGSVYKWFKGTEFSGGNATKNNFIKAMNHPAIFHLAMHSMSDSINSRYSYLMFDTHNKLTEEGKLYNYEISLSRIKSPMVVLSACNSGSGTLYSGEGLMSLARGFILAGASSVIKTEWDINDETSTAIITRFYYYLSKGKEKNEAMRFAKLEYLKNSAPVFKNPYYWAAYEVLGDTSPVSKNFAEYVFIISIMVIFAAGLVLIYFKRRKIFSERSL